MLTLAWQYILCKLAGLTIKSHKIVIREGLVAMEARTYVQQLHNPPVWMD